MISDAAAVSSIYHDIFLLPCFIISSILNGICEEARIHADQWQDAIPFTSLNSHTLHACATDAETVSEQEHTQKNIQIDFWIRENCLIRERFYWILSHVNKPFIEKQIDQLMQMNWFVGIDIILSYFWTEMFVFIQPLLFLIKWIPNWAYKIR